MSYPDTNRLESIILNSNVHFHVGNLTFFKSKLTRMGGDFQVIYNEMASNSANQTAVILNNNEESTLIVRPIYWLLFAFGWWCQFFLMQAKLLKEDNSTAVYRDWSFLLIQKEVNILIYPIAIYTHLRSIPCDIQILSIICNTCSVNMSCLKSVIKNKLCLPYIVWRFPYKASKTEALDLCQRRQY